jgi:hypothetical protein
MRTLVAAILLMAACSSDKKAAIDAPKISDAKGPDAPHDAPKVTNCPGCTVTKCESQLQGCATQSCLTHLMTFNNCMQMHGSMCGTMFAAGGAAEAALWQCLMTMCASDCGTQ